MNRFRILPALLFICLVATAGFAQEKVVDNFAVNFGIISWDQIQSEIPKKPATHTEEYHYRMAKEMATMHKGGEKGMYHILVVIDDKKTGERIDKADVRVTFIGRRGPETVKLQPMTMDNFAGFGEFVRLRSAGPYAFTISFRLSEKELFKEVTFVIQ